MRAKAVRILRVGTALQERFESSAAGRVAISVFVAVIVLLVAIWQLPPGNAGSGGAAIRRAVMKVGSPVMYATGLDQNWGVFAPPRMSTITLSAKIRFSDGTTATWSPPTSTGALFGAYRDYRWGKLVENAVVYRNPEVLFPLAIWLARQRNTAQHRPVDVAVMQRYYLLEPITNPGAPRAAGAATAGSGPWQTSVIASFGIFPFMLSKGWVPRVPSLAGF